MFDAGLSKKDVLGGERLSRRAGDKLATALRHEVYLVARMWLLAVNAPQLGQLDYEGAMFKHHDIVFAQGTGQTTKCCTEIDLRTFAGGHGDDVNNTLQCEPQTNRRGGRVIGRGGPGAAARESRARCAGHF